jgi:hypothetical protein
MFHDVIRRCEGMSKDQLKKIKKFYEERYGKGEGPAK